MRLDKIQKGLSVLFIVLGGMILTGMAKTPESNITVGLVYIIAGLNGGMYNRLR